MVYTGFQAIIDLVALRQTQVRQQNNDISLRNCENRAIWLPKKDIIILLPYLGLPQKNEISKSLHAM